MSPAGKSSVFDLRITQLGPTPDVVLAYLEETFPDFDSHSVRDKLGSSRKSTVVVAKNLDLTPDEIDDLIEDLEGRGAETNQSWRTTRVVIAPTATSESTYTMCGQVSLNGSTALHGIRVRLVSEFGGSTLDLGSDRSDDRGRYSIAYERAALDGSTEISVLAYDDTGNRLQTVGPLEVEDPTMEVDIDVSTKEIENPLAEPLGDDVFRFAVVRPPTPENSAKYTIVMRLLQDSSFFAELLTARAEADGRRRMLEEATAYLASDQFIADTTDLTSPLSVLEGIVRGNEKTSLPSLRETLEGALEKPIADIVSSEEYQTDVRHVEESLLAASLSPGRHDDIARLTRLRRLAALLEDIGADKFERTDPEALKIALNRVIRFPSELFPLPKPRSTASNDTSEGQLGETVDFEPLQARFTALEQVRAELESIRSTVVRLSNLAPAVAASVLSTHRSGALSQVDQLDDLRRVLLEPDSMSTGGDPPEEFPRSEQFVKSFALSAPLSFLEEFLSDETTATLAESGISISLNTLPDALTQVEQEKQELDAKISAAALSSLAESQADPLPDFAFEPSSDEGVSRDAAPDPELTASATRFPLSVTRDHVEGTHARAETGEQEKLAREPRIQPIGVGDLKVVRQWTDHYELGEVAHIENVLKGERKNRFHTRETTREEIFTTETVTEETTERDLQKTDRFEFQRETENSFEEETELEAGMSVSAEYGPYTFATNVDYANHTAREESTRVASNFMQEVTERTTNRIQTRIREERMRRLVEEIEERNEHLLENDEQDDHTIGVYRWVDKVYANQLFNYGQRRLYEFIIPEPAAFYLYSRQVRPPAGVTVDKPLPPKGGPEGVGPQAYEALKPEHIRPGNYEKYVAQYDVTNSPELPAKYRTVSIEKPYNAPTELTEQQERMLCTFEYSVQKLAGYVPYRARITYNDFRAGIRSLYSPTNLISKATRITTNGNSHPFSMHHLKLGLDSVLLTLRGPGSYPNNTFVDYANEWLSGEMNEHDEYEFPLTIHSKWARGYSIGIELVMKRTEAVYQKWQSDMFAAIMQAYQLRKSEYESQVAQGSIQDGVSIAGGNPGDNRQIEQQELKRGALTLLIEDNKIDMDALLEASDLDIDPQQITTQGDVIQFLEQAFEWEQMMYHLYPYYWSRRGERSANWIQKLKLTDPDPKFEDFLKAGAARVVVPVRRGFETHVEHYLTWGETWSNEGKPGIGRIEYVPLEEEILGGTDTKTTERMEGPPLSVRLPTSLVRLQSEGTLPTLSNTEFH